MKLKCVPTLLAIATLAVTAAPSASATSNTISSSHTQAVTVSGTSLDVMFSGNWFSDDFPLNSAPAHIDLEFAGTVVRSEIASIYWGTPWSSDPSVEIISYALLRSSANGTVADGELTAVWHLTGLSPGSYTLRLWDYITYDTVYDATTVWTDTVFLNATEPINSVAAATVTYNGSAQTPPLSSDPGGATYAWSVQGGSSATTGTNAGTYSIPWSGTGNYAGSGTASWTISPKPVTFSLSPTSFTYTGNAQGPTVVASDPAATFTTGGTLSAINAGSYTATVTATGNYTGSNSNLAWVINPCGQTITFPNPGPQTYGTPLALSATASSGLPVSFAVTAGLATLSGNTLTFTGIGNVTITASQAGNANCNAAPSVAQTFTVNPKRVTFSLSPTSFTYNGSAQGPTVIPSDPAATFTTGGTLSATNAGNYTATVTATGNYTGSGTASWTISPKPVTFSLSPTSFTYTGSAQGPTVIPSDPAATFTTGGTLSAINAGSYTATATATGNYTGSNNALAWTIGKADQTITFPNPGPQTYGTPLVLSATASSGLPVSFTVTAGPATLNGNTLTFTGTGPVTVTASQAGNGNYNAAPGVARTFSVNAKPVTFSLSGTSFTYTGSAQGPTVVASDPAATFTTAGTLSAINAGSYTATATATGNYTGSNDALDWTIGKVGQTITFPNPGPQTYGTPLVLSATASSGLPVSFAVTAGPATLSGNTLTFTGTGSVIVTVSQAGNADYNAAPSFARTFAVDTAAVTFSLSPTSFTYTGSAQGPAVVASDPAATFTTGGTLSAINAGSYTATATATGNYSGGNDALDWTIDKADQTITFANPGPQVSSTPLTLSATASSGLPVSYTVTAGPATVSGSTVTFSGTGSVTITASQPGDGNWNPAVDVVAVFSVSGVLDDFNRADGELGANWTGSSDGLHYLIGNEIGHAWYGGPVYWSAGVAFGPSQQAFVTFTAVNAAAGLDNAVMLKVQSDPVPANESHDPDWIKGCIVASYNAADHGVYVATWRPDTQVFNIYASQPLTLADGDVFGARALANGDIQFFRNGAQVATVTLDADDQAFFNGRGGRIGLWFDQAATAEFDDFGGGALDSAPQPPPI